jgi:hypothetical protein
MVHILGFRKGQGLADIAGELLSQGAIPTFHVIGLSTVFSNTAMSFFWENLLIGIPKITEGVTAAIFFWNLVPQVLAGFGTMIANHKGYDLTSSSTNGGPEPVLCGFDEDKRPHFIQFQHIFRLPW